jgi:hypothetical protein
MACTGEEVMRCTLLHTPFGRMPCDSTICKHGGCVKWCDSQALVHIAGLVQLVLTFPAAISTAAQMADAGVVVGGNITGTKCF